MPCVYYSAHHFEGGMNIYYTCRHIIHFEWPLYIFQYVVFLLFHPVPSPRYQPASVHSPVPGVFVAGNSKFVWHVQYPCHEKMPARLCPLMHDNNRDRDSAHRDSIDKIHGTGWHDHTCRRGWIWSTG